MDKKNVKFFDGCTRDLNKINYNREDIIEEESFLLLPRVNSKKKTKVELKNNMHPKNYDVELKSENIKKTKQYDPYYGNHYGPGRGFGNMDMSNDIRKGQFTRLSNDVFFKNQETMINERSEFLSKNFQDPKNLILPFTRGGETTRKSTISKNDNDCKEKYDFEY